MHPDYAGSLNNLGHLYDEQGKYELAVKFYVKCLELTENILGK